MFSAFKEFINKGNVVEFAVAVIMATAFGAVVNTFTKDVLMPPLGLVMGGVDFEEQELVLKEGVAEIKAADGTVTNAGEAKVAMRWGKWLNTVINFLIISFVLFLIVRAYNNMSPPPPDGPTQEDLLTEIRDALKR